MKGVKEMEYITIAVDLIKDFLKQWDSIENVAIRLIDFAEKLIFGLAK